MHREWLIGISIVLILSGCSSHGPGASDTTAPTWITVTDIGVNDDVVITFDESIDTGTLVLSGTLAAITGTQTWSRTSTDNDTLTLTPPAEGWYGGLQNLMISVQDTSGNSASDTTNFAVRLKFNDFQAAAVVIGQGDFSGNAANRGATAAADSLYNPDNSPMVIDGRLWISDASNNRILGYDGIPTANGASASYVIGQTTFSNSSSGTTDSQLYSPADVAYDGGIFYISDLANNRVLVHDGVPLLAPGKASRVVGQADFSSNTSGCTDKLLNGPDGITAVDGKLIVADSYNHRVLIWNSAPTSTDNIPPDLVLGQSDFTHCMYNDDDQNGASDVAATSRTLYSPGGVWSDGTRLIVADSYNNRLLVWNNFPTSSFTPADVVLGQGDFAHYTPNDDNQDGVSGAPTARTLETPTRVWSNDLQLIVLDQGNNRVLVWNNLPTVNFLPADTVLGQSDFTLGNAASPPSAQTFSVPWGIGIYSNKLLVTDTINNRVLVFQSN